MARSSSFSGALVIVAIFLFLFVGRADHADDMISDIGLLSTEIDDDLQNFENLFGNDAGRLNQSSIRNE
jgi:hypothetical protein